MGFRQGSKRGVAQDQPVQQALKHKKKKKKKGKLVNSTHKQK
jgi:hypothetical protein